MKDFFISYNHNDKDWAEWIAWVLEKNGFSTIIQSWDFKEGSNFVVEMENAMKNSKRTIAILSENYLKSSFTRSEWTVAFASDPEGITSKLLPIKVRECQPTPLLQTIVYLNLMDLDEDSAISKLIKAVSRLENDSREIPENVVFPSSDNDNAFQKNFPGQENDNVTEDEISEAKSSANILRFSIWSLLIFLTYYFNFHEDLSNMYKYGTHLVKLIQGSVSHGLSLIIGVPFTFILVFACLATIKNLNKWEIIAYTLIPMVLTFIVSQIFIAGAYSEIQFVFPSIIALISGAFTFSFLRKKSASKR